MISLDMVLFVLIPLSFLKPVVLCLLPVLGNTQFLSLQMLLFPIVSYVCGTLYISHTYNIFYTFHSFDSKYFSLDILS